MKIISLLLIIIILQSCSQPIDPKNNANPVYASVSAMINGNDTPCLNCILMEVNSGILKISFGQNLLEECSQEKSISYQSGTPFRLPNSTDTRFEWIGQAIDGNRENQFCVPDSANIEIYYNDQNPNIFDLVYIGKSYKIKRIN